MKKRSMFCLVLLFASVLTSCSPGGEFRYNKPDTLADATPPYIEGGYLEEITPEEFEQLSGLKTEGLMKNDLYWCAEYDGEGRIVNIQYSAGNRGTAVYMALHSHNDWSPYSYSPASLVYGGTKKESTVQGVPMIFGYCKGEKFGFDGDMYLGEFVLDDMLVNIQMSTNSVGEFEAFINKLIEINK
ncbi:MAG: hypothetical protein IKU32_00915 [Clostridia bacterium]|nr:hypothetical protein [Clostridia bacterium]